MSVFDCADCGRQIGECESHVRLRDDRVVCMAHYVQHLDAGRVVEALTRAQATERRLPAPTVGGSA